MNKPESTDVNQIIETAGAADFFSIPQFALVVSGEPLVIDESTSLKKLSKLETGLRTQFGDETTSKRLLASVATLGGVEQIFSALKQHVKGSDKKTSSLLRQSTEAQIVRFEAELESAKALVLELFSEARTQSHRPHWDGATAGSIKSCSLLLTELAQLGVILAFNAAMLVSDAYLQNLGSNVFKLTHILRELGGNGLEATEHIMDALGVV
jgi:hypothetical protein